MHVIARAGLLALAPMAGGAAALLTAVAADPGPARVARPVPDPAPLDDPTPPPRAVTVPGLPYVAIGRHYRVHTDVSDAVARRGVEWLDAVHASLVERFGATASAPTLEGRLTVMVYSDTDAYRRRPESALRPWPVDDTGAEFVGFFRPRSGAHACVRPDAWFRRILVHEAAHQLHAKTLGFRGPRWFFEGVAEDVEHDFACETELRDCEVHQLQLSHAVRVILAPEFDLADALWGDPLRGCDRDFDRRSAGFAIVRFLREGAGGRYAAWFRSFERQVSRGARPCRSSDVHARVYRMERELLAFVRTHHAWHPRDRRR